MDKSRRQQRLARLFQEAMSEIIDRELHLPRDTFIAISRVEISADLKKAWVYLRVFGASSGQNILPFFVENRSFIRKILASKVNIKYNPELFFAIDHEPEYEEKIDRLLKKIKEHE